MQFNELRWLDPRSKSYMGSPSIVRLDATTLLACHDFFGPESSIKNHINEESLTAVYRSEDNGETWDNVTFVINAFWSNLFLHKGSVYMLGTSRQWGAIVIRRSDDGGLIWTNPFDSKSGLLFPCGDRMESPNYHCAPMPVLYANGRIYRAFEDNTTVKWPEGFKAAVVSADADCDDLLDAGNWTISNKLTFEPEWVEQSGYTMNKPGWLEGNIVQAPDGKLYDVLRFNSEPDVDVAAYVEVSEDGKKVSFDPKTGFKKFPGGDHKFSIRYDEVSKKYVTLSNNNTVPSSPWQRNVLSLCASENLFDWKVIKTLIKDEDETSEESLKNVGFQYVDWQFDGDDIIYLVRTAYDGAHNFHDSNRITFHKLENFRSLL